MSKYARHPSRPALSPLIRRPSVEESYHLADTARRKSSDKFVREDLRQMLGHVNILEQALQDIALGAYPSPKTRPSPPPSPTRATVKPAAVRTTVIELEVDEFGFGYGDDGEEDLGGLTLTKTMTRRSSR